MPIFIYFNPAFVHIVYISASLYTIVKLSMKLTKLVNKVGNCVFIASVTFEALQFSPRAADSTHLVLCILHWL